MKLRALIVDDMPLSRSRARRYLGEEPDVEIVGECGDAEAALADVARLKPDLLVLDVQMPGLSGLAMLEHIPAAERPAVVFITAFEEFAVPAFAAQAVDYLLKPFDHERLKQALAKVRTHLKLARSDPSKAESRSYLERVAVKSVGKIVFVNIASIEWIESAGNYMSLHCGKDTHLLRETMGQIEERLDPEVFVRISRSTIVRIDAIRQIEPLFNGDRSVTLRDGTALNLSRSHRDRVKAVLGNV